ncbi:MAG: hypothetical protein F4X66_03290 [Chloroflexi bacterium]|nr:hypothetical protein [Chloroflexota bacterium]MYE41787.1 hypothetical protein [Chloroflexota bacterium]
MTDHLKASPPERYEEISRHLLEQAREELDKGDIPQASDKVWGATAHAVKAVCQRMGWNHHAHNHLRAAANYVFAEFGRYDLTLAFGYLEALHANYYEHQWEASDIRIGIINATLVIRELSAAPLDNLPTDRSHLSPLERQGQERRLRMLTRKTQYSHGPQLEGDELDSLPPVKPSSDESMDYQ